MLIDRRRMLVTAALVAVVAGAIGVWSLSRGGHAGSPQAPSAAASRGDIVVTVGGIGRIVEARAAATLAVPAAAPSSAATAKTPSSPTTADPGSVFPAATGRVARFLVGPGERVAPGEAIAILDDGGVAATAVEQARTDAATARLELQLKRTSDPAKGLPPTPDELRAARLALLSAKERARLVAHPPTADTTAARLDVRKAGADLATLTRAAGPDALAAARLAIDVATQRLAQAAGAPLPVDVAAAQAELAKAQADLDTVRATSRAASEAALEAARLAVTLAQQRLAELPPGSPASDRTAAQLDLAKAQADLEALQRPAAQPAPSAVAAAQAAVDLANQKLAQLTGPPSPLTVSSAQLELRKARADLETLQRAVPERAVSAARLAVVLAQQRLQRLLHPGVAALDTARSDSAKAAADLQVLLQRGAPAGPLDIAIARLKVAAADERVRAAELQTMRLVVRTPFGGTVTSLLSARGAPADPTTPVATVADLRHLGVSVDLSEFDVARVHRGQEAVLSVDALGGRRLAGRVGLVAFAGVDTGGVVTFPVRVTVARPSGVKPGMNVSVRIVVAQRRNVVRVPLEAVHDGAVTVVGPGGRELRRRVTLGLADNKLVEVRSGLRAGQRVALPPSGG